jgi:hypothetical protein
MKFPIQHSHLAYSRNKINRMFLELDACESTREGTQGNLATYVPWVDSAAPQHQNDTLVLCCTILQIAWRMSNHCAHWYLYQFNHLKCLIIINLSNQMTFFSEKLSHIFIFWKQIDSIKITIFKEDLTTALNRNQLKTIWSGEGEKQMILYFVTKIQKDWTTLAME